MANIKNKVIFSFLCLIFYTALSLSFYLIPFNSKVLSIIDSCSTSILDGYNSWNQINRLFQGGYI